MQPNTRQNRSLWQRLCSVLLVFAMVATFLPAAAVPASAEERPSVLYLQPSQNWKADNARFAAYFFGSGETWVSMTDEDGDGYYECTVPEGYPSVIFCRMNPNTAENNWNNKWNQTGDLTVPTDGDNCYTVAEGTWDNGGGTWSSYTPQLILYVKPNANWQVDNARFAAYFFGNGETWVSMTDEDGDGYYECAAPEGYSSVIFCRMNPNAPENNWNNKWNQTADLTVPTDDTNCYTVAEGTWDNGGGTWSVYPPDSGEGEPSDGTTYALVGYINGSDLDNLNSYPFQDGKLTVTFNQNSYVAVKSSANANWYMTGGWLGESTTSATLYDSASIDNEDKLFVPGNVEVTFTLTENADDTLTLSYTTASSGGDSQIPEGYTAVTVHFMKPDNWGNGINAYIWTDGGALTGYSEYNSWPGKAISASSQRTGWYDLVVATENPTSFYFIFNDGGNQTANLETGAVTGDTELWVVGNTVYTTAPGEWSGDYDYTANIHFKKPASWGDTINAWIWDANGALPGYEQFNTTWPGSPIEADAINTGWYNVSVTADENSGFYFILNDGSNQTDDLSTGTLQVTTDLWVVDGQVQTSAPAGWVDPNRTAHVPGTFPGPSWDAASNQMTYDPELGLYVYTFENVPAANYEYKISINGSWTENYGVGGIQDGANMAVTVPSTQDVTIYYNDKTHTAVCSVTYIFADITLSGTGIPQDTKLSDPGLTGIYSAAVDMAAGTYTDIKLTYNGKDYTFEQIQLDSDKTVTFYMDPVTGIYYNDASNTPIDAGSILYDSKDAFYKAPYGAVATDEEVTFSLTTGDDITSAVLVVKGVASYPMTKNEDKWSTTVSFANIGEYDYYFVVSNGSAVAVYGDDDGYYGQGTVCDLTTVQPYDLVVYEAGFETPDWMKNAVIYQIFPDRFANGNPDNDQAQTWARGEVDYEFVDWDKLPSNPEQQELLSKADYEATGAYWGDGEWGNEMYGGDLQGIMDNIDYLKDLGVTVIYLNPVFWSISNHRYDAVDYTQIDPILGTLGDFEELVALAEENDMHIILDGVFNHVSDDSVYFDRYYRFLGTSEKIGAYPYWAYVYDQMNGNNMTQTQAEDAAKTYFTENYGITDWSYTQWFQVNNSQLVDVDGEHAVDNIGLRAGKPVYGYEGWWGYDSMPVIKSTDGSEFQTGNWAEEIIYNEDASSVTQYWITKGNNGWRLDVANEVSDETWQNFRDSVKAMDSDAVIVGEIWDDATKYLVGDMYDSVMNYEFRRYVLGFVTGIKRSNTNVAMDSDYTAYDATRDMERLRERYPEEAFYAMMNLVDSHDTSRLLSYLDGILDDRSDKSVEKAFPTYETTSDLAKAQQYLVAFLQFTYAGAPTIYYGDEIGTVGADDPDDRRTFEWDVLTGTSEDDLARQDLLAWYSQLAKIRSQHEALRTGSVNPVDCGSDNILGYIRAQGEDKLVVLSNSAQSSDQIVLDMAELGLDDVKTLVDLISGEEYSVSEGQAIVTVDALRGVILQEKQGTSSSSSNKKPSACNGGSNCPTAHLADVNAGDWFHLAADYVVKNGMMVGTTDTTFSPDTTTSRAMTVTILWSLEGKPQATGILSFADVAENAWYAQAVNWAAENGIVAGYSTDTFGPDDSITREQMAAILMAYAKFKGYDLSVGEDTNILSYEDAFSISEWAIPAMQWACGSGLISGRGADMLAPAAYASRAEAAVILKAFCENVTQ